jgi:hypothetical protein
MTGFLQSRNLEIPGAHLCAGRARFFAARNAQSVHTKITTTKNALLPSLLCASYHHHESFLLLLVLDGVDGSTNNDVFVVGLGHKISTKEA